MGVCKSCNGSKWIEMGRNGLKWVETVGNGSKCIDKCMYTTQQCKMIEMGRNGIEIKRNGSKIN